MHKFGPCASLNPQPGASVILFFTHRLQTSSFLGLPYMILNISHKKELLWSLWVVPLPRSPYTPSSRFPQPSRYSFLGSDQWILGFRVERSGPENPIPLN